MHAPPPRGYYTDGSGCAYGTPFQILVFLSGVRQGMETQ